MLKENISKNIESLDKELWLNFKLKEFDKLGISAAKIEEGKSGITFLEKWKNDEIWDSKLYESIVSNFKDSKQIKLVNNIFPVSLEKDGLSKSHNIMLKVENLLFSFDFQELKDYPGIDILCYITFKSENKKVFENKFDILTDEEFKNLVFIKNKIFETYLKHSNKHIKNILGLLKISLNKSFEQEKERRGL